MMTIYVKHRGAIRPTEVFLPSLDDWAMAIPDPLARLNTVTGDLEPVWLFPEYPELSEDTNVPADDVCVLSWEAYEDFLNAVGL